MRIITYRKVNIGEAKVHTRKKRSRSRQYLSHLLDIHDDAYKCSEITGGRNEARYYLAGGEKTRAQPLTKDIAELVGPLLTTSLTHGYVHKKKRRRRRIGLEKPGLAQKSKTNKWAWRHRADESRHPAGPPPPPPISFSQVFLHPSLPRKPYNLPLPHPPFGTLNFILGTTHRVDPL